MFACTPSRAGSLLGHLCAFSPNVAQLCRLPNIEEAVVLSTCNRFEVYIASHNAHAAIRDVMTYLQERSGLPQVVLRRNLFMLGWDDAVWHLLRVSAGLDSLVVGEGQILSQVKKGCLAIRILPTCTQLLVRSKSEAFCAVGF